MISWMSTKQTFIILNIVEVEYDEFDETFTKAVWLHKLFA